MRIRSGMVGVDGVARVLVLERRVARIREKAGRRGGVGLEMLHLASLHIPAGEKIEGVGRTRRYDAGRNRRLARPGLLVARVHSLPHEHTTQLPVALESALDGVVHLAVRPDPNAAVRV